MRLVARGMSVGLFVYGSQGGLGKSRTVLRTLADEGVSPVLVNSHITPLALYATLYHNRSERVIFFDDVDSIFGSMSHLGLLRSALWGDPRIVTYGSSQLDDLPGSFIFESQAYLQRQRDPPPQRRFQGGSQQVRHLPTRCDPGGGRRTHAVDRIGWL